MDTARTDNALLNGGSPAGDHEHKDKAGLCTKSNKYTSRKLLEYGDDNS